MLCPRDGLENESMQVGSVIYKWLVCESCVYKFA